MMEGRVQAGPVLVDPVVPAGLAVATGTRRVLVMGGHMTAPLQPWLPQAADHQARTSTCCQLLVPNSGMSPAAGGASSPTLSSTPWVFLGPTAFGT